MNPAQDNDDPPGPLHSPATWRQIVDSATDTAIIATDRQGRVTTWNEGARRILGWSEAEMLGRDLSCIFVEADRVAGRLATEMADAAALGRGGGEEGWRLRKDGRRFWAVGEMTPIRGAEGAHMGFVKVLRDRTAQRRAAEQSAEEQRALEVLNRVGSALAVETDLQRLVQIVTDAGAELTGAEFGAFFCKVSDEGGGSYLLYTLAGQERSAFSDVPAPREPGLSEPVFAGQAILRSDDITLDARFVGHARGGMPLGHLPVRSYLAVPVISREGEVIGGLFFGHAQPGVFSERSERGLSGLAAEAAVAIDNARLAAEVQRELAERRRAEEALRELNATLEQQVAERTAEVARQAEALRQSQKMEAVGQLTGGVAHDFNNLLQVIVGNLEVVKRSAPPDAGRLLRAANAAMNGARRASALTQRLLAFARRQPLDPKPIDANVLVSGMSELLHRTLGETIAIETVLGAGLWRVEVDPNELESTILNLAVNARDAMPGGGRLTIETANAHIDDNYVANHAELTAGQYVMLSVSDTGTGMDAETLRQAFEPFFTTKPVGRGTGLGLSQVYGFVKQSGGHVKLYSEPGLGTTVRIYLPRLLGTAPVDPPRSDTPVPAATQSETVLVVEDDDDVRAYSADSLRELGYRVLTASDGPTALRLLRDDGDVDLLFTDVVLPGGLTGAEVATQARALRPGLRVLFTTGYARNAIVHHGRLDNGVQLITKPFSFADLASKVRDVLDGPPQVAG